MLLRLESYTSFNNIFWSKKKGLATLHGEKSIFTFSISSYTICTCTFKEVKYCVSFLYFTRHFQRRRRAGRLSRFFATQQTDFAKFCKRGDFVTQDFATNTAACKSLQFAQSSPLCYIYIFCWAWHLSQCILRHGRRILWQSATQDCATNHICYLHVHEAKYWVAFLYFARQFTGWRRDGLCSHCLAT